jgi:hypothetical protein
MATGIPLSLKAFASVITKGVLPVPPTEMFPTLMTGQGSVFVFNSSRV